MVQPVTRLRVGTSRQHIIMERIPIEKPRDHGSSGKEDKIKLERVICADEMARKVRAVEAGELAQGGSPKQLARRGVCRPNFFNVRASIDCLLDCPTTAASPHRSRPPSQPPPP